MLGDQALTVHRAELAPQPADMHVDGAAITPDVPSVRTVWPDVRHEVGATEYRSRVRAEEGQQLELLEGQSNLRAVDPAPDAPEPGHFAPESGPAASQPQPAAEPASDLLVDHVQRRVWIDGAEVTLTFQEFELLAFLSAHPATVFSRADLVQRVWQRRFAADSRTVDVHVSRLRHKLGPAYGRCLVTEYRVGYQFRAAIG